MMCEVICWSMLKHVKNMLTHIEAWWKLVKKPMNFTSRAQPGSLALLNAASDAFVAAPAAPGAPSLRGSNLAVAQALHWQWHCTDVFLF